MRGLATAVLTAVVGAAVLAAGDPRSVAADVARPHARPHATIFVEGDSITSKYGDVPGSPREGWWSIAARRLDARVVVDAQGGSGFVKPGETGRPGQGSRTACDGTTFAERLRTRVAAEVAAADVVVIEGGRNDFHTCARSGGGSGHLVPVAPARLRTEAGAYFAAVASLRPGRDPRSVYVMTPWGGHTDPYDRQRVVPVVRAAARAQGFTWVDLGGVLDPQREGQNTWDGIHPDADGSRALAGALLRRSDIRARLRASAGSVQAPVS